MVNNKFLQKLHKDISSIKKSKKVFIFADKTRYIYETDKNSYSKLLTHNISKTYKKTGHNLCNKINKEVKLLQITMEFQNKLIVLQNQTHLFL